MSIDKQRALLDPGAVFATPEEVRDSPELTIAEKTDLLRRWAYDAAEVAVAVEEGMPEVPNNDLQRRIFLVLAELTGDLQETGPTKQHGLEIASTGEATSGGGSKAPG